MNAKSLPEQSKYLPYVLDDMFEHVVELIEMALILYFFNAHQDTVFGARFWSPPRVVNCRECTKY